MPNAKSVSFLSVLLSLLLLSCDAQAANKLVLFDIGKREDAGNADWRIDGAYSSWADALKKQGYTVDSLDGRVSRERLKEASVLVIPEPQNPFNSKESEAIYNFVKNGGGLLMISDHRDSDRDFDGWDSPEVFNGWDGQTPSPVSSAYRKSLNSPTLYGLTHSFDSSFQDSVSTATPLGKHPVLNNVLQVGVYVGTPIEFGRKSTAVGLLGNKNMVFLAANTVGKGRVLAFGDSSTFSDGSFTRNQQSRYNNWGKLDNAKLALNMIAWLAKDLR